MAAGGCNDRGNSAISGDAKRPESAASQVAAEPAPVRSAAPAQDTAPLSTRAAQPLPDPLRGTVKETMGAGGYTYVLLATQQGDHWAAAKRFEVAVGNDVEVAGLMPMADFTSPTLKKTFEQIQFVSGATVIGGSKAHAQTRDAPSGHPAIGGATPAPPRAGEIEVPPGGVTVAELFEKKAELNANAVKFSGRVVKVNRGILGSNWLHVQDGTGGPGSNDITVTSATGFAEPGSVVLIQGVLALERDFGAGYKYDVIVEDATVTIPPPKPDGP